MTPTIDWTALRTRYPVFRDRNYLASLSIGPMPAEALDDLADYGASRARHTRSFAVWLDRINELTALVERLLGAPPASVALRDSATACQAAIAAQLEPTPGRDRIVVSALDFHSSLHLWRAQERRGFEVVVVPPAADGASSDAAALAASIDDRTVAVAVAMTSRYTALLDLAPVVRRAREVGALTVVDGYQVLGILPIDVIALGVDVFVGGANKWLSGCIGCAFMYVAPELAARAEPRYPGWFGHGAFDRFVQDKSFDDTFTPRVGARRFQQGSPGIAPIYLARAGIRIALEVGVPALAARNAALVAHLHDALTSRGYRVMTPRQTAVGALCVALSRPQAVVDALADRGIDVDQRRNEVLRVAPHPCTTLDECDDLVRELVCIRPPGYDETR